MPKADRLSQGAVKLLQEPQLAHFTTLMKDGAPQTTPVWVDVEPDGGHVLINTADTRLKTANVERDPRVSVSVVDAGNAWRYALVRGRVVERRHEGAEEHIDALALKYLGQETYPYHNPAEPRVILRIKPDHVMEQGVEG
jgi:PPOX class probable F420-dependent enzyme